MIPVLLPVFSGFCLSAALIMAIGAQNLFVLQQGLRGEHVALVVLFCSLSDALLITVGVSGLGTFLGAVPEIGRVLAFGGSAFLAWYGFAALHRMRAPGRMIADEMPPVPRVQVLAMLAAFTFLNPHVYLDTVLLMGAAGAAEPSGQRPLFIGGAASASVVWFASLGYGGRLLRPIFARPIAWRILDAIVGCVMLTLAASLILRALAPDLRLK